ncbi:hypothetical protein MSSAC_4244 [Methanosarcina siciliae C2J]|uniref:Uncharacterized protein n=1 Tax=Methanosarcina siciliae C2J TaxID=1434118 RepID=A0A0E3PUR4_9EURY|nr:hypothetical protein [Methanosarcina siciliae]AKB38834.1 hypothetical protein MSSAC_4244 [Methanosarcina siciliae C2J]
MKSSGKSGTGKNKISTTVSRNIFGAYDRGFNCSSECFSFRYSVLELYLPGYEICGNPLKTACSSSMGNPGFLQTDSSSKVGDLSFRAGMTYSTLAEIYENDKEKKISLKWLASGFSHLQMLLRKIISDFDSVL